MKYILCECGKRYQEGNKKHFDSIEHKKYIESKKINESNEMFIIVHDIDKNELLNFLKSKAGNKRRLAIYEDEIEDITDKDYKPNETESESESDDDSDGVEVEED